MRRSRARAGDGGMVTAELAACLPVLVLLLAVALSTVSVASARVRAQDAAREAARAAARGAASVLAQQGAAESGLRVRVVAAGGEVTAVATLSVHLPVPFLTAVATLSVHLPVPFLSEVTVTETAVAALEPDSPEPGLGAPGTAGPPPP